MTLTILGCGTSGGVPELTCSCPVCVSDNPRNKRTRSSLLISHDDTNIVIDTSPEFRLQALKCDLKSLDAVLFTHAHADHLHGLDDIRPFTKDKAIPLYGNSWTIEEIRKKFDYFFTPAQKGGGVPAVNLHSIKAGEKISIGPLLIEPILVKHGILDILGYRIGNFAYITDCSFIPTESFQALKGIEYIVIGALRYREHSTHFNLDQAIEAINSLNVKKAWLTHMTHDLDYEKLRSNLPNWLKPAYDNQKITL